MSELFNPDSDACKNDTDRSLKPGGSFRLPPLIETLRGRIITICSALRLPIFICFPTLTTNIFHNLKKEKKEIE